MILQQEIRALRIKIEPCVYCKNNVDYLITKIRNCENILFFIKKLLSKNVLWPENLD